MPASVTVSCDNNDDEIRDHLADIAAEFGFPITLVGAAPGTRTPRQVRNNAVRAHRSAARRTGRQADPHQTAGRPRPTTALPRRRLLPRKDAIAKHARLAESTELVIPFRVNTTKAQLAEFDESEPGGRDAARITEQQRRLLEKRHRRYARQQRLKRIPVIGPLLVKPHKPKLLGGHHSVRLSTYIAVNGRRGVPHLGNRRRRLLPTRLRNRRESVIAIRDIDCLHLYHPPATPASGTTANAQLASDLPTRCAHGLDNSMPQGEIEVVRLSATQTNN